MSRRDPETDFVAMTGRRIGFEVIFQQLGGIRTALFVGGRHQHIIRLLNQVGIGGMLLIGLQLIDASCIVFQTEQFFAFDEQTVGGVELIRPLPVCQMASQDQT